MNRDVFQRFEEEVKFLRGEVIRGCRDQQDFEEKACARLKKPAGFRTLGFYNPEDRVGVFFPDLEQGYAIGSWKEIGKKPALGGYHQVDAEIEEYKKKFKMVSLSSCDAGFLEL